MAATVHCITLPVDAIERAVVFYRDGLGLPVVDGPDAGDDHVPIALPGGLYLVLILRSGFTECTALSGQPEAPAANGERYTWEESAIAAMRFKGFDQDTDWSLPRMLYRWERYNGFGYRSRGVPTPRLDAL